MLIIHGDLAKLPFNFGVWEFLAIFLVTILCTQNQNFQVRTKTFAKKKKESCHIDLVFAMELDD
jgi:hypothetical protein